MKFKKLIILLFVPMLAFAQNDTSAKQQKFGVGLGHNFNSVMGDTIRPFEVSLRYKLNDKHTFQLYAPFLTQNNSFRSEITSRHFIQTVLDTKKKAFGIGIGYDYAVYSFSFANFLVGARAEYLSFNYETDMSNNHIWTDPDSGRRYDAIDYTFYTRKGNWFAISPEIGIRTEWNRFFFDAKLLLSGVFLKKEFYMRTKANIDRQSIIESIEELDWTYPASESFKIKPAVSLSVSYYF